MESAPRWITAGCGPPTGENQRSFADASRPEGAFIARTRGPPRRRGEPIGRPGCVERQTGALQVCRCGPISAGRFLCTIQIPPSCCRTGMSSFSSCSSSRSSSRGSSSGGMGLPHTALSQYIHTASPNPTHQQCIPVLVEKVAFCLRESNLSSSGVISHFFVSQHCCVCVFVSPHRTNCPQYSQLE